MPSIPTRTCVGCGQRGPKDDLLRLVCGPDGFVRVDVSRREPGRGAHVHPKVDCLVKAEGPRALGRAFRGRARRMTEGALLAEARSLLGRLVKDAGTEAAVDLPVPSDY